MQTWKSIELIYPMVANDYNLKPVRPVPMAEGAYEHGSAYGFDVLDPRIIVRINGVSSMADYRAGLPEDDIDGNIGCGDKAPPENEILIPWSGIDFLGGR